MAHLGRLNERYRNLGELHLRNKQKNQMRHHADEAFEHQDGEGQDGAGEQAAPSKGTMHLQARYGFGWSLTLFLSIGLLGCSVDAQVVTPSPASTPSDKIAFVSDRDGNEEIYLMRADGNEQTNLTNHPADDFDPAWSPDGLQIAFISDRDGDNEIYTVNADGSNLAQVTHNTTEEWNLIWSPDGTKIAFESDDGNRTEIYLVNADGSGLFQLTNEESLPRNLGPAWSPDGRQIVFAAQITDSNHDLYVIQSDGAGLTPLAVETDWEELEPQWSPDGIHLAYTHTGMLGTSDSSLMNFDGSGKIVLAKECVSPQWSPDGTRLACNSFERGIHVFSTDNAGPNWFTEDAYDWGPIWSWDGNAIAFVRSENNNDEIHAINADGSGLRRLTDNLANDSSPAWQPRELPTHSP